MYMLLLENGNVIINHTTRVDQPAIFEREYHACYESMLREHVKV